MQANTSKLMLADSVRNPVSSQHWNTSHKRTRYNGFIHYLRSLAYIWGILQATWKTARLTAKAGPESILHEDCLPGSRSQFICFVYILQMFAVRAKGSRSARWSDMGEAGVCPPTGVWQSQRGHSGGMWHSRCRKENRNRWGENATVCVCH